MPGSRFHPYLSTQDEARLASENSFRTQSILNSSVCPPHRDSPQHPLSSPYTVIEGTRWQPDVVWSGQYSPMEQNLLAMEHQRLALHQQQSIEAPNQQQMEALLHRNQQQQMEALLHRNQQQQMKALLHRNQQQQMGALLHPNQQQQMEALLHPNQQQQMEALLQQRRMATSKQQMEAFRRQQCMEASKKHMEALLQQQKMVATKKQQQQQWMETPNLTYMADNSHEFIGCSQEYNRYMADSSQQYIRYMDKLRLISEASVPSVPTGPVLPTLSVPVSRQSPMQDQPLNLSLKDRFEDSTRGSSDLSTTHSSLASATSDSMSTEKLTESNMSPEPSLVKLSYSKSSLAKHTLPKKRSYKPDSEMIRGFNKLSHPLSDSMKSSEPHLMNHLGSKNHSEPSSKTSLAKLTDSEKTSTESFPGRLSGPGNFSSSKLAGSKKLSRKPSSLKLKDFEKTFLKTSSSFAVKIHPTKPIEVGGLEPEVVGLFPHLKATEMGTIVLWNFLWALLADSNYQQVLRWIDQPTLKFKVFQPEDLARLWGIVKKNTSMNLEKLMKVIDLYVKKDILKELDEKFAFQFAVMPET